MLDGNNGGYANDWLLADNNTGEVARFEIGLKLHRVWRTKDGYYVGRQFPQRSGTDQDGDRLRSPRHVLLAQRAPR